MTWFSKNWKSLILSLILPALIVYRIWRVNQLDHYAKFTIATTQRRFFTAKGGFQIEYAFYVNGKRYTGSKYEVEKYHIHYPGSRYFVKYSFKFPGEPEIQWDRPVADSIKIAPSDGWKEIPGEL